MCFHCNIASVSSLVKSNTNARTGSLDRMPRREASGSRLALSEELLLLELLTGRRRCLLRELPAASQLNTPHYRSGC